MGFGKVGIDFHCTGEVFDGLVELILFTIGDAKIPVYVRMIGKRF